MQHIGESRNVQVALGGILTQHPARPFLAEIDQGEVRVHAVRSVASAADRRDLVARLREAAGRDVRLAAHGGNLFRGRSIETIARISSGEIVFDPTGIMVRSRGLVEFAAAMRRSFGRRLGGIFWSSDWRTLYVVFDPSRVFVADKVKTAFLAEAENQARAHLRATCGAAASQFISAIRLGFEAPEFPVVAVDDKSARLNSAFNRLARKASLSALGALFGLGAAGTAATAADINVPAPAMPTTHFGPTSAPAVSGLNGKIAIMGGSIDWGETSDPTGTTTTVLDPGAGGAVIGEGSVSMPLSYAYGFQLDGAVGSVDGDTLWGVGAHLFWRDPARGLLGLIGSYSETDMSAYSGTTLVSVTRDIARVGAEAELYFDMYTVSARAGAQWGTDDGFFGDIDLTWYATPDFALSIGGEYSEGPDGAFTAGLEYQPNHLGLPGLSLFADGAVGDDQYRALGGVRYYFGAGSKSLIERHRYDDPVDNLATSSAAGGVTQTYLK